MLYRYAILEIKAEVSSGNQMNWAMRNSKIFPDMVVQMVAIGEESGSLDGMLPKSRLFTSKQLMMRSMAFQVYLSL